MLISCNKVTVQDFVSRSQNHGMHHIRLVLIDHSSEGMMNYHPCIHLAVWHLFYLTRYFVGNVSQYVPKVDSDTVLDVRHMIK